MANRTWSFLVAVTLIVILLGTSLQIEGQITFQTVGDEVYLRHGGENIIELTNADQVDLFPAETVNFFGNFIINRQADRRWKQFPNGFFNNIFQLGLSFDGFTVTIKTFTTVVTVPDDGLGFLYVNKPQGVAFYTESPELKARIGDAILGDPDPPPPPPPDQGSWSSWSAWTPCSVTCDSGFRTRVRECTGCTASCCVCPPDETFQIEECLVEFCEGQWSSWSPFSSCSRTCDGGFRTRERICEGVGSCDFGDSFEHEPCNTQGCCN